MNDEIQGLTPEFAAQAARRDLLAASIDPTLADELIGRAIERCREWLTPPPGGLEGVP